MLRILFLLVALSAAPLMAQEAPAVHASRELISTPGSSEMVREMIWSLVLFVVFFGALSFLVWPKILGALKVREQKMRTDLEGAEKAAKEAKATLEAYNRKLTEAQQEAGRLIGQARADAEKVAAQLRHQSEVEINTLRQRATAEIAAAKEAAVNELYEQAGALATQVAGQILRREIKQADQQALINESLSQIKSRNN